MKIDNQITADAVNSIDVKGRYVAPGIIDDQVHFRDPGLTEKGDIFSESQQQCIQELLLLSTCQMSTPIPQRLIYLKKEIN